MVNMIGSTLFLIYTLVYYVFTVNKRAYVKQFGVVLAILIAVIVYTNSLQDDQKKMIHLTGECKNIHTYYHKINYFEN